MTAEQPIDRFFLMFMLRYTPLLLLVTSLVGCSPGYVVRAAYEQSKILLARRPIVEVLEDATTTPEDREKISLVIAARTFASEIGLEPGKTFTQYADIGKDTLAWVVMASRKDSFTMYTWWFPIVGTVPYKGFFDRQEALDQAQSLEQKGYESSVRGTEAFSTLGWFNDPLLSTTLKNPPTRIVNTVIHETVHATVWIAGHVAFNESLANFVGSRAAIDFFKARAEGVLEASPDAASSKERITRAEQEHRSTIDYGECIGAAFEQLSKLYGQQSLTSEEKIAERQLVFDKVMAPCRERYPTSTTLRTLNNAELLQSTIYMTGLRLFEQLHDEVNGQWLEFFSRIREVKRKIDRSEATDPFLALRLLSGKHGAEG